ncbi:MAG: L-histidine N(alpha)-methyltransferase [Hyphomicrobiaceae bacterium]|nr:L-histidine N(alpha)-methyltransferase [Hyphomicrobiaceae bacterium]
MMSRPRPNEDAESEALATEPGHGFAFDVTEGLSRHPKTLPCRYFYDARGSELFDQITQLPEYYPTSVETDILAASMPSLASEVTAGASALVEFGSGSSMKTEILLRALPGIACYIPIDVSGSALDAAADRLASRFPRLDIRPTVGDFTQPITIPSDVHGLTLIGFFPGSTIGNFAPDEATSLLAAFRSTLAPGGRLLIGADLKKDVGILIPAYDDAAGVTAAFNLNLLTRINRELGGNFDLARFRHKVIYDSCKGRIEMHLESTCDQVVTVAKHRFCFRAGETIHTENSHKFTIGEFQALARTAGWQPRRVWTDERQFFSVHDLIAS